MAFGVIRELVTRLGFTIDDAEARRYEKRLTDLGRKIRGVGRSLSLFVTLPIVALGASFIKAAADAEETESKFKEVFKGINDEADIMSKNLSRDFDLANVTAQEMLATTGSLLVQFGFTAEAALEMSNQVASLSVDIASFENVQGGAKRATLAITKALLGQRESLQGINKVVLEEDVTRKIAILRSQGMTFETKRQAKAIATLALITEQANRAIGDYNRTQDSATNRTRKLEQRFIELSVEMGKVLLPLYVELTEALISVVEWINSFSAEGRRTIVIIAGIAAALGPLLIVLGAIVGILAAIPVLAIAAVAAVGALAFLIGDDIRAFLAGEESVFGLILEQVDRLAEQIEKKVKALIGRILAALPDSLKTLLGIELDVAAPGKAAGMTERRIQGIERLLQFAGIDQPTIDPQLARLARERAQPGIEAEFRRAFEADALMRAQFARGEPVTVHMEMTLNGVTEGTARTLGEAAGEGLQRAFAEAQARAAASSRMAP